MFTDLDATLLDPYSYSWEPATEALNILKIQGACLILVSSKTFPEMKSLSADLGFYDPMVVENGGGITWDSLCPYDLGLARETDPVEKLDDGKFVLIPLGMKHEFLLNSLEEISNETRVGVRSFSGMTVQEVSVLTGLDEEAAAKSQQRWFDEPFLVLSNTQEDVQKIQYAAKARGLEVVQGGRFWHLMGHGGKGAAVSLLIEAHTRTFGKIFTIGLGDSPNDFPFLALVDQPVIVGGLTDENQVPEILRRAIRTVEPGPVGWNSAMCTLLSAPWEVKK